MLFFFFFWSFFSFVLLFSVFFCYFFYFVFFSFCLFFWLTVSVNFFPASLFTVKLSEICYLTSESLFFSILFHSLTVHGKKFIDSVNEFAAEFAAFSLRNTFYVALLPYPFTDRDQFAFSSKSLDRIHVLDAQSVGRLVGRLVGRSVCRPVRHTLGFPYGFFIFRHFCHSLSRIFFPSSPTRKERMRKRK